MPTVPLELVKQYTSDTIFTGGNIQWHVDGRYIYTTCGSVVKVLDSQDGALKYQIAEDGETSKVTAFVVHEDLAYVCYMNGICKMYALPKSILDKQPVLKSQWKVDHNGPVLTMAVTRNNILATGGSDFVTKIWNPVRNQCLFNIKGPGLVSALTFVGNEHIYIGYASGHIKSVLFNKEGKEENIQEHHTDQVTSLNYLLKGKLIVSTSRDNTVAVIKAKTNAKEGSYPSFEAVESGTFNADSTLLMMVGEKGTLKVFNLKTLVMDKQLHVDDVALDFISYNPAKDAYLISSVEQNIVLVNAQTLRRYRNYVGFNDEIFDTTFVSETTNVVIAATNSAKLRLYNIDTWSSSFVPAHEESCLCVDSPGWDEYLFASGSKDNNIRIWKLIQDNSHIGWKAVKLGFGAGHTKAVNMLKFSSLKKGTGFVVSISGDNTIKLWDLKDVTTKNPDSEEFKMTAACTMLAHQGDVVGLDISQNDKLAVTGSLDKTAKLWHINREGLKFGIAGTLQGHKRGVWSVKFSPNSQHVITGCGDHKIRLFSLGDKACVATLDDHEFPIVKLATLEGGKKLVAADSGGMLKVWNMSDYTCENTIEAHEDKIWSCETILKKDGEVKVVSAGTDGKIILWRDGTKEAQEVADEKTAQLVADTQCLNNLMHQENFGEAMIYALNLQQPFTCLKIVNKLIERGNGVEDLVSKLNTEQTQLILDYASKWNTNNRKSLQASYVLNGILKKMTPDQFMKLHTIRDIIRSFLPYNKRHHDRLEGLVEDLKFVDFTAHKCADFVAN